MSSRDRNFVGGQRPITDRAIINRQRGGDRGSGRADAWFSDYDDSTPESYEFYDDFNRADGPLGENWTTPVSSQADLKIVNGQLTTSMADAFCQAFWSANAFEDDQFSEVTIVAPGSILSTAVRVTATIDRCMWGTIMGAVTYIFQRWDGGYYEMASSPDVTWASGDTLRTEITGSGYAHTVTVSKNDVPVLSWTNQNPDREIIGGSPGISMYNNAGVTGIIDNWEGGSL